MKRPPKYGAMADHPQSLRHPNWGGPTYRSSREAFGRSLPYDDAQPTYIRETLKAWGIFLAIIAVFALIAFFIHPHWSAHEPSRDLPERTNSRIPLAKQPLQVRY